MDHVEWYNSYISYWANHATRQLASRLEPQLIPRVRDVFAEFDRVNMKWWYAICRRLGEHEGRFNTSREIEDRSDRVLDEAGRIEGGYKKLVRMWRFKMRQTQVRVWPEKELSIVQVDGKVINSRGPGPKR